MGMRLKNKSIVFMIDGFDFRYYEQTEMVMMQKLARESFFKRGSGIFPSLTNANNISIACGCWPEEHGVTTNCYYDESSDRAVFLEAPSFLTTKTLFEQARESGSKSALLTCKAKTTKILSGGVDFAVAAEDPDPEIRDRYGNPPPMYSSEINYWLCDIGLDLLERRPDLDLLYIHTTDYPMHMWAPDEHESQLHMQTLDYYLGMFLKAAPNHTIALTADHGMNKKNRCWDLARACSARGVEVKFAVSPVADRLLKHHRGFGGVSYVHLHSPTDEEKVKETLLSLDGVEQVLDRKTASQTYGLMESRIGDLVVFPDIETVFGDLEHEFEELGPNYRSHGSLYELEIPLLLHNVKGEPPRMRDLNYNLDLTRFLFHNGEAAITI